MRASTRCRAILPRTARWRRAGRPAAPVQVDRSKSSRFEGEPEGAEQLGFLAQDLEALFPEVVVTDSEGFKSIKYDKLTVLLAQGLKEQQASIAALHARLDAALARLATAGGPAPAA